MTDWFVRILTPIFGDWGYLLVFAGCFLENSVFLGLIVPGETILVLGGFFAATGTLQVFWVAGLALVGAFIGDSVGYWLGRSAGRSLLERYGHHLRITEERTRTVERYFEKHGGKTVLVGRFTMFLRAMAAFTAGMYRMSYMRFLLADTAGALAWVAAYSALGYFLGYNWEEVELVRNSADYIALGIIVIVVAVVIWKRRRLRRETSQGDSTERCD
jgi:undecaprenyl-diphosphatase